MHRQGIESRYARITEIQRDFRTTMERSVQCRELSKPSEVLASRPPRGGPSQANQRRDCQDCRALTLAVNTYKTALKSYSRFNKLKPRPSRTAKRKWPSAWRKLGSSIGTDIGVISRELTALDKAVDSEHQKGRETMEAEEADRYLAVADRDRETQALTDQVAEYKRREGMTAE